MGGRPAPEARESCHGADAHPRAPSVGWEACITAVLDAVPPDEPIALVGHSGASPLPLAIADLCTAPTLIVFVDANVPPVTGDARLVPDEFSQALQDLAKGGVLPRWSEWFAP